MRVVGGSRRGRKLTAPVGEAVRPTSDRVREAIFDVLGSQLSLDGMRVLDLFAGTGAMGIEALSRGAASATFVEADAAAAAAIGENLAAVALDGPAATVVRQEALHYLQSLESLRAAGKGPTFDLVFCDPPYSFDRWSELVSTLPCGLAVLESAAAPSRGAVPDLQVPSGWMVIRSKRYGGTLVTVVRRAAGDPEGGRT